MSEALRTDAASRFTPVASTRHTVRFVGVFLVVTALLAVSAWRAHGGTPAPSGSRATQYVGMLAFLWGMWWFAQVGVRARGVTVRDLVGGRWRSTRDVLTTLATSVVFLVFSRAFLFLAQQGLAAIGQATTREAQHTSALVLPHGLLEQSLWVLLSLSAGFCEEYVFRGYLQRQFSALARSEALGITGSALVFGLGHAYQGWRSVVVITIFGLLFGLLAHFTRSLRPGMVAHALQDIVAGLLPGLPG